MVTNGAPVARLSQVCYFGGVMHIPDGYLSPAVLAALGAASVAGAGLAAHRASRSLEESRVPLMGMAGAFVFAAQMINFPVAAGASGHLLGGALLAITLGTAPAAVVMTAILAIQALLFQDGGVLALGANVFNMALAGVLAGAWAWEAFGGLRRRRVASFAAGVLSAFVAACFALAELAVSGIRIPGAALWAALGIFALTALLEGAITAAVVAALDSVQPGLLEHAHGSPRRAVSGLLLAGLVLAAAGFLMASSLPDGLEHLAERIGIAGLERSVAASPMPGYEAKWLPADWLQKAGAGLLGLAVTAAVCWAAGRWIARWRSA
ncbi:MAG: energy-coupling factor ABC transporter permease [Acidobacteriota bacterium]